MYECSVHDYVSSRFDCFFQVFAVGVLLETSNPV
eukprot:CAMPEP_0118935784 /NCGR_PEP_ID=MMETSP1169-20130426/15828_1 /TAXON_ID=36882 /ORGANISM="Pyramimonas obovata, Strain CCMP722" /LENGTH=33 /DNA_ID= /DNA_START= /DNA_END= /DNA_ORIENTATION=